MPRLRHTLLLLCLMASLTMQAQINLSLWQGLSTQRADSTSRPTLVNIGLQSKQYRLQGISINALGTTTVTTANGLQAGGLFNITGTHAAGIQLAGITNVTGGEFSGLSFSGLVNIVGNDARGIIATGLVNIVGGNLHGMAVAGMLNINETKVRGIQMSGVGNIASHEVEGLQLSGIFNIATGSVRGIQAAALLNLAGTTLSGMQVGAMNVAVEATGLQVGLVNYYRKRLNGVQLGLVNLNPSTRRQLLLIAGSSTLVSMGMRFKNRTTYTVLTLGSKYHELHPFNIAMGYRAGLYLPVTHQLELSGDLGYQHIETFKAHGSNKRLYNLQARLNAECNLNAHTSLFLTGGYERAYTYRHGHNFHNGLFIEAGTALNIN